MTEITKPTIDEYGAEVHPSFGVVRVTRPQCNPPRRLFDSSIGHREYVHLEIARATRRRELHHDWIHSGARTLIEIKMTLTQWGALVSSFGHGSGTPVTISSVDMVQQPEAAHESRLTQTAAEVAEASEQATSQVVAAAQRVDSAFAAKAGRREMGDAIKGLMSTLENLPSNMKFTADSLTRHAEDVVSKAKADIEASMQFGTSVLPAADPLELEAGQ
jgi:hypothetical protein